VATNIRLPKEDLEMYRQMAIEAGVSFAEFTRKALEDKTRAVVFGGNKISKKSAARKDESIWKLKPFSSGIRDGARNHDKYIYGDPHNV